MQLTKTHFLAPKNMSLALEWLSSRQCSSSARSLRHFILSESDREAVEDTAA